MTPRITSAFPVMLVFLSLTACKKSVNSSGGGSGHSVPPPIVTVLGTQNDSIMTWKNGQATSIFAQSHILYNFSSSSLVASGNDVYVAGFEPVTNNLAYPYKPVFWLNGAATSLSDSNGTAPNGLATAVAVSGGDVYVAGLRDYFNDTSGVPFTSDSSNYPINGGLATVWKNGTPLTLPGFGPVGLVDSAKFAIRTRQDYVTGIVINGQDIYVSGGTTWNVNSHAAYWKNGTEIPLVGGSGNSGYAMSTSIYVSGSSVYVAGFETPPSGSPYAMYWVNGNLVSLNTDSADGSIANSVFVDGSDVYVVGWQNVGAYSRATVWKNGVATSLSTGNTASTAYAVTVLKGDVYVAGATWLAGGYYVATYWKNGAPVYLSNANITSAIAYSISVQ